MSSSRGIAAKRRVVVTAGLLALASVGCGSFRREPQVDEKNPVPSASSPAVQSQGGHGGDRGDELDAYLRWADERNNVYIPAFTRDLKSGTFAVIKNGSAEGRAYVTAFENAYQKGFLDGQMGRVQLPPVVAGDKASEGAYDGHLFGYYEGVSVANIPVSENPKRLDVFETRDANHDYVWYYSANGLILANGPHYEHYTRADVERILGKPKRVIIDQGLIERDLSSKERESKESLRLDALYKQRLLTFGQQAAFRLLADGVHAVMMAGRLSDDFAKTPYRHVELDYGADKPSVYLRQDTDLDVGEVVYVTPLPKYVRYGGQIATQ